MTNYSNLPNNSDKSKLAGQVQPSPEKREKVITGRLAVAKPSMGDKIKGIFNPVDDLGGYLVNNVIKPGVNNWLHSTLSSVIDAIFGGGSAPTRYSSSNGYYIYKNQTTGSSFDYTRCSSQNKPRTENAVQASNGTKCYNAYVFDTKSDAEVTLSNMVDILETYGVVCINDYYELIGITGDPTGQNYGWVNLSQAVVKPTGIDGWRIELPKVVVLPK